MIKKHLTTNEFIWIAIVFWAATFTAMEAPFSFAFKTKIQPWQVISDAVISALFIADLLYHLRQREKNHKKQNGDLEFKFKWNEKVLLLVDLFSCIPFDILAMVLGLPNLFLVLRLFRLVRIVKVYYLLENITIIPNLFRIQAITLFFLIVVNWIACGWILIYPVTSEYDITTYFIRSFYWALTTLTTIGYGDITPKNNIGMIYTCFVMLIGVGMYGIVIGNITRMLSMKDRYKEQTREKMNDLLLFMKHYNVPDKLQTVAINHYNHLFSKRLSENDEKIIADLPHALQVEMQIYMKIKLLSNISIFANCSHECQKEVALSLEQVYSSPGDKIISVGELGHEMYVIAHGSVEVVVGHSEQVATLHDGQVFGEVALIKETKRSATVQSLTYCDLYKLTADNFNRITKTHPMLLENILKATKRRTSDEH
jgi:hypothetical protein